jgi:hypothetical protein
MSGMKTLNFSTHGHAVSRASASSEAGKADSEISGD